MSFKIVVSKVTGWQYISRFFPIRYLTNSKQDSSLLTFLSHFILSIFAHLVSNQFCVRSLIGLIHIYRFFTLTIRSPTPVQLLHYFITEKILVKFSVAKWTFKVKLLDISTQRIYMILRYSIYAIHTGFALKFRKTGMFISRSYALTFTWKNNVSCVKSIYCESILLLFRMPMYISLNILIYKSSSLTCWERQTYLPRGLADPNSRDMIVVLQGSMRVKQFPDWNVRLPK